LIALAERSVEEGRRILACYDRIVRHAHKYAGVARLHLAVSGPLLEQLGDPAVVEAWRPAFDLPSLVEGLRSAGGIEFLGSGFRHPVFPLIPVEDWAEHLAAERALVEETLGRAPKGFRAAGDLFSPALVPALVKAGYEYLVLPASALARPDGGVAVDPFTPCRLEYAGVGIAVAPYDDGLSAAQAHGLDVAWFADEVRARAGGRADPALVTTWSDGENGEWFRAEADDAGFFGAFYSPYMEFCETGEYPVRPVLLSEALRDHPPVAVAAVARETPCVGTVADFVPQRWEAGSPADHAALARLFRASGRFWSLSHGAAGRAVAARGALAEARTLILAVEGSDMLVPGAAMSENAGAVLGRAEALLDEAERRASAATTVVAREPAAEPLPKPEVTAVAKPAAKAAVKAVAKPAAKAAVKPGGKPPAAPARSAGPGGGKRGKPGRGG
jgi:hypothetical protein